MGLKKYNEIMKSIDSGNTHRLIASRHSNSYMDNKKNLAKDTLLIEIDWKQKILIGNFESNLPNIRVNTNHHKLINYKYQV